jgi:hypothetical protein
LRLSNYIYLTIFVLVSGFSARSQTVARAKHSNFHADNLGNVYTVNNEELCKFLPGGKLHTRYSNLKLGNITTVDVSNPLKILVYYRDFQQIIFLDNQLSVNSNVVSLERLGLEQALLVCSSANNSFWIYNQQNNELLRFDESGKRIASTGNLKQVLQAGISPAYMLEHNGFLFLSSPGSGIYVFDMFGAFSKLIALPEVSYFQPKENLVYYQKGTELCSYNHRIFEEACRQVRGTGIPVTLKFQNDQIYLGNGDSVVVHPIKK